MTHRFGALRRLLDRFSPAQQEGPGGLEDEAREMPPSRGEREARPVGNPPASKPEDVGAGLRPAPTVEREGGDATSGDDSPSPQVARLVTGYLNLRAGEMLALLVQELTRETAHELRKVLEDGRRATSAEIAEVRDTVISSQRDLSRMGRELVRAGATLETISGAVSSLGPAVERLEASLRAELAREYARERQLREEVERTSLEDMLAALDGLEAGLEEGRELVAALSGAQRRLKDATVQRWWRAMAEATGVKRPLPEVPLAEVESWIGGLELTHRRLQDALARRGVTPIEAVGKPFDPYLHEAVAVEPGPEEQDGLVLREERRGYRTSDRVIRLSQVVVGRAAPVKATGKRRRPSRAHAEQIAEDQEVRPGEVRAQHTEVNE